MLEARAFNSLFGIPSEKLLLLAMAISTFNSLFGIQVKE